MIHFKNCQYCDVSFLAKRSDAKYCSQTCRQLGYMKRIEESDNWIFYEDEKINEDKIRDVKLKKYIEKQKVLIINEIVLLNPDQRKKTIAAHEKRINRVIKENRIDEALKKCIFDLHKLEQKRDIKVHEVSKISVRIRTVWDKENPILPGYYRHANFILFKLFSNLEEVIKANRNTPRNKFHFDLGEEFRREMSDVYFDLDRD